MARYRALSTIETGLWPTIVPNQVFTDVEGDSLQAVPAGWIPGPYVDCLDRDAAQKMWNAGVQLLWKVPMGVAPPKCYWTPYPPGGGTRPYILTGIGAALGFRNWIETRGANP
jgi:hypothetical protein